MKKIINRVLNSIIGGTIAMILGYILMTVVLVVAYVPCEVLGNCGAFTSLWQLFMIVISLPVFIAGFVATITLTELHYLDKLKEFLKKNDKEEFTGKTCENNNCKCKK